MHSVLEDELVQADVCVSSQQKPTLPNCRLQTKYLYITTAQNLREGFIQKKKSCEISQLWS